MDRHPRTPHAQAPSLIPLKAALIAAERLTPSRPPRRDTDPNGALAERLIVRTRQPRPMLLTGLRIEPPQPVIPAVKLEMAGRNV
jgi:hypothetical protein